MQFEIAHKDFSAKLGADERLRELQYAAFQSGAALVLSIERDTYRIAVEPGASGEAGLIIEGRWISDYLRDAAEGAAEWLLVPYAFLITRMVLPPRLLGTLGRDYRSLTDFFMRNYYNAVLREAAIEVQERRAPLDGKQMRAAQNLTKAYTWILKSTLKEPVLESRNALELILAGLHVDLMQFDQALLQGGMSRLRAKALASRRSADGYHEFDQVRQRVLLAMGAL